MGAVFSRPVKLEKGQNRADFDCGNETLNVWLKRYALQNQAADFARTFVVIEKNKPPIVAFYSLATGAVERADATEKIKKGLPQNPQIPIMLLARLAVDLRYQGMGLGKGLLKDAMLRTLKASQYAGIRGILVHAKDEKAGQFYEKYGFEQSPVHPLMKMLRLKDLRRIIKI